jgi:hypothetical protein
MVNLPVVLFRLQERMAAVAGVLDPSIAMAHDLDAVPEQAAQVAHFLLEPNQIAIGVALGTIDERMPALDAHVFARAVAIG